MTRLIHCEMLAILGLFSPVRTWLRRRLISIIWNTQLYLTGRLKDSHRILKLCFVYLLPQYLAKIKYYAPVSVSTISCQAVRQGGREAVHRQAIWQQFKLPVKGTFDHVRLSVRTNFQRHLVSCLTISKCPADGCTKKSYLGSSCLPSSPPPPLPFPPFCIRRIKVQFYRQQDQFEISHYKRFGRSVC